MTEQERDARILEFYSAGIDTFKIAKLLGTPRKLVQKIIRADQAAKKVSADNIGAEWNRVARGVRETCEKEIEAERRRKEMEGRVVYIRCSSGSGYWWERGFFDFGTDHRGAPGG